MSWMVEHGFEFPHHFEVQGSNIFLEMNGGLSSTRSPYGDCENELWNSFDPIKVGYDSTST
ncbi:hypothetical protein Lal_00033099 [Lupinus albus]|nr:hypothetical protein Lal_00033099 [Lupinus albus]